MPALKLRIPHADRPYLPIGVISQVVKAALVEALASGGPVQPVPASLPGETVSLWMSDEQLAKLDALATEHRLDSAGSAGAALLHALARQAAEVAPPPAAQAVVATVEVTPEPIIGDVALPPKPAARQRAASHRPGAASELLTAAAPAPITAPPDPLPPAATHTTLDAINAALGNPTRVDQGVFYARLVRELFGRAIAQEVIFAEAATGIGKSRAFEAVAVDWCRAFPEQRVAITAPNYNVLLQSIRQWQRIAAVFPAPPYAVVVGQQEFVSRHALERVLSEHPDTPGADAAAAWLRAQGAAPEDDPFGHRWLLRSLRTRTAGAWTLDAQVQLDSDVADDDPGMLAYRSQFAEARKARVLFCTHAMLAVEVRRVASAIGKAYAKENDGASLGEKAWAAWEKLGDDERKRVAAHHLRTDLARTVASDEEGRLPPIDLLVVDEAHLLESAFASVFATGISVARLMRTLRHLREASPQAVTTGDLSGLDEAWQALREIGAVVGSDRIAAKDHGAVRQTVAKVRGIVAGILTRAPKKIGARPEVRHLRAIRQSLDVAANSGGEARGMSVRVSWSPSVHWPSIEVGRYDVSRELDFLWALLVRQRSVLVSATLFDDVSAHRFENARKVLSVRYASARAIEPVRPAWLFDPVTLHLVGPPANAEGPARFRRPTVRDALAPEEFARRSERWRDELGAYVASAYASAAGGMLVLMTAYEECAALAERLGSTIPAGLLLEQRPDLSLEAARHRYFEILRAGERPCLIGVGGAWTGLDLSGDAYAAEIGIPIPVGEDNVLTDLVIPLAPFGTQRSLTHEWRREKLGFFADVGATAILARQGIGRLVRREGLPTNRRLHFLDARIHEGAWSQMLQPIVRALAAYSRRVMV